MNASVPFHPLQEIWDNFQIQNPNIRIRDAAELLGVSELELLATENTLAKGSPVTRLQTDWHALLPQLESLGRVMVLARNNHVVHERVGTYAPVEIHGDMALVLGQEIDLRLFLSKWRHCFAVRKNGRCSLQVFDAHGTAIQKIFLTPDSHETAYEDILENFLHPYQTITVDVEETPQKTELTRHITDEQVDINGWRQAWSAMEDVHEFHGLLKKFKLNRVQGLRLAGHHRAKPVAPQQLRHLLTAAAATDVPVMVFVANAGIVQIHSGIIHRCVSHKGWFNILDKDFNLHVRESAISQCWRVCKPTQNGIITSLECYDEHGTLLLQLFGVREEGEGENPDWRNLMHHVSSTLRTED